MTGDGMACPKLLSAHYEHHAPWQDVHHGNGTQHMFEEDDRVLFISLHQVRRLETVHEFISACCMHLQMKAHAPVAETHEWGQLR